MGFDLGHPGDDVLVAHQHPRPPAATVVALGEGVELYPRLLGPGELEEAGSLVPVEGDLRVGVVMHDDDVVGLRPFDQLRIECGRGNGRRRIVGVVHPDHPGTRSATSAGMASRSTDKYMVPAKARTMYLEE